MRRLPRRFWFEISLFASFGPLIYSHVAYSMDVPVDLEDEAIAASLGPSISVATDAYTINFNNISIIEFIRFVSKITNLNFVFEEGDLQFTVTVVSEEPVSARNVTAALAQVLRVHGLTLLEQESNVLIVKSTDVNQIPTIISSDLPQSKIANSAIVTQVFRIKNANITSVANIIRPMTSKTALIEISNETRQLIVTDIATNVEKIAALLVSLDSPHTPLEIETYVVEHIAPTELIQLTQTILAPFAEGNPLIFVPQIETNSIFVVSTPYLIERAMTVMEDLDMPTKPIVIGQKSISGKDIFVYQPVNLTPEDLLMALRQVGEGLKATPGAKASVETAVHTAEIIKDTRSLLFVAEPEAIIIIKELLASLDTVETTPSLNAKATQVFAYSPQYTSHVEIQAALKRLLPTFDPKSIPDLNLAKAIETMEWNGDTQSFIITGDAATVERFKTILTSLDGPEQLVGKTAQGFFLYKLQNTEGNNVLAELKVIAKQLPQNNIQNQNIAASIDRIQWIENTNALLITGPAYAIERIQALIADLDIPLAMASRRIADKSSFLIYKPKQRAPEGMLKAIPEMNQNLQDSGLIDPQLFAALSSMTYTPDTESFIFTGSPEVLKKVEDIVQQIDVGSCASQIQCLGPATFLIYPLQHVTGDQLTASIKGFAKQLDSSTIEDKTLATALDDMRYIRETNSLLFIAPKETLQKIEQLIPNFDIAALAKAPPPERPSATYVVYNPRYLKGGELIAILDEFESNLQHSGVVDEGLFDAISNLKWIEKTSSLLISGHADSVAKVQELIEKFDVPPKESGLPAIEDIDNTSFLVYKLQYHQGSDIRDALKQVGANLSSTAKGANVTNPPLMEAINSIQWIQVTNSLLATGEQSVLVKLKNLIQNLDVPLRQVFIEVLVVETDMGNTQNFGLMWGTQVQYMNKTILSTGNFPIPGGNSSSPTGSSTTPVSTFSPLLQGINANSTPTGGTTGVPFTSGFDLGVIGDIIMHKGRSFISLGSLVNAIQLDTNSTIVMNPKIVAQDNQQSMIFVGTNVPYTGAVVTTVGSGTQQSTSNIEYRDVGVSLTITPILGDNNIVTLDVVHDISSVVTGGGSTNSNQLTGITTTHTHMETRVHVPDQHFVALSGMIQDTKQRYRTAIPCLGGLPVIGALFSENDRNDAKSNIIIFMRPFIINSYEQFKEITEHQEWTFKDQSVLPVLKEDFDAALDIVKTPDNE